jgi:prepilin-type N-terminal cleavage/methylation domain-containing protein
LNRFQRAFTLVELLVVISILAILSAILMPALVAAKGAVQTWATGESMRGFSTAFSMYASDCDDTAPLAMYQGQNGLIAWFGAQTGPGEFDQKTGILGSYLGGKSPRDATFKPKPWLGDGSGFGYNWGYIGSDFNMQPLYVNFPNCINAARLSELQNTSNTIVFTTSSYFNAPWLPNGDSETYDFGFIDPPKLWKGNPNVDFRHQGAKSMDPKAQTVTSSGLALVLRADGSLKTMKQTQVTDAMFER